MPIKFWNTIIDPDKPISEYTDSDLLEFLVDMASENVWNNGYLGDETNGFYDKVYREILDRMKCPIDKPTNS